MVAAIAWCIDAASEPSTNKGVYMFSVRALVGADGALGFQRIESLATLDGREVELLLKEVT